MSPLTKFRDDNDVAVRFPLARRAVEITLAVEGRTAFHESSFGRDQLVEVINDVADAAARYHVDEYRYRIVRENTWPNVDLPDVDHHDFVSLFGFAALTYVDAAFDAARWLQTRDTRTLVSAHRAVLVSEALRGQFGKSSPDGLDARLERAVDQLLVYLDNEDDIYTLCSSSSMMKPAEIAMVADFQKMKAESASMPDSATVLGIPPTSATWVFFRRHCRWRFDRFVQMWEELSLLSVSEGEQVSSDSDEMRDHLLETLPARALELADFVSALNIFNLSLEPTSSFKGGPGLLHAEVFRAASHLAPTPVLRQLALDRDALLAQFQSANSIQGEVSQ
jgi:hypothetical protein